MLLNNRRPLVLGALKLAEAMRSDDHEHIAHLAAEVIKTASDIRREAQDELAAGNTCQTCHGIGKVEYGSVDIPCPDCQDAGRVLLGAVECLGVQGR